MRTTSCTKQAMSAALDAEQAKACEPSRLVEDNRDKGKSRVLFTNKNPEDATLAGFEKSSRYPMATGYATIRFSAVEGNPSQTEKADLTRKKRVSE